MKIPMQWLAEWVDAGLPAAELGARLTMAGFELEALTQAAPPFTGVFVARIVEAAPHPHADKLRVCRVSLDAAAAASSADRRELQVVCGARNARAGLVTALAAVGARLPGGVSIGAAKLRGVESFGMLCSATELGLADASEGIIELPADAPLGQDLRRYLALDDTTLELNVTPNRGDAMSVLGIAREVGALFGKALSGPRIDAVPASLPDTLPVALEADAACPRLVGRVIRGIDPAAPAPMWMRERLRRAGVRSISAVVDVTNYVLLELGQPMHAYDRAQVQGGLSARLARNGESCMLLDGREVELQADMLVIADEAGPVGLAGIMGGARTAVSATTRDVFLEAAHFVPAAIAGRGRRFGLTTDAGQRFERGVDPGGPARAVERATALILQIAGGQAGPAVATDSAERLRRGAPILLREGAIERLLGLAVPQTRIQEVLRLLGMQVSDAAGGQHVMPPTHRFDITIERDLIEEVARIVGYDAIPEVDSRLPQRLQARPAGQAAGRRWLDTMAARGFYEAITFAFVDSRLQRQLFPDHAAVALDNPIASDLDVMRVSLWPGLIAATRENQRRQASRVRLFEQGVVFEPGVDGAAPRESGSLAAIAWGARIPEQWGLASEPVQFADLQSDLEALLSTLGATASPAAPELVFEPASRQCLHPGRSAQVRLAGTVVGWIGELHPEQVRHLDLAGAPILFELNTQLLETVKLVRIEEPSRFPAVRRDLAIVVEEALPFSAIRDRVTLIASGRLRDLTIFDIYRGTGVEPGRKSLALGLIFQEKSRTLTDAETDGLMADIRNDLQAALGARVRE